eukprot:CAMPEP_0171320310 /NCGR_PEP_ID=MMETSP0816-20121228/103293_1 /TAXON_ID=420281 /ORGANISM="Proboscia inermis, Strain CCAP1064/1" /LENGTH=40 /DNA_ID= /DNA_START= /DNA_END= /DNA_ORIENTATION=
MACDNKMILPTLFMIRKAEAPESVPAKSVVSLMTPPAKSV